MHLGRSARSVYRSVIAVVVFVDRVVDELLLVVVPSAMVVCPTVWPISSMCMIHAAR